MLDSDTVESIWTEVQGLERSGATTQATKMLKFTNKIYRQKAQQLLNQHGTSIAKCSRCAQVYSTARTARLGCTGGGGNAAIKLRR